MAHADKRDLVLMHLQVLARMEKEKKNTFGARAYDKVIKQIKETTHHPIVSLDSLAHVTGIGKGIREKLERLFADGTLDETKDALGSYENEKHMEMFTNIMSVGPVKARELVTKHGMHTIDQLRERATELLNDKQQMGLKYYDDFLQRIPRKEMTKHHAFIKNIIERVDKDLEFELAGSYRRGLPTSGDIDVLIRHPDPDVDVAERFQQITTMLTDAKYITDTFAKGDSKVLAVCRLPRHKHFRRIDLMMTQTHTYPFALLYFTGSQQFNIKMRSAALAAGYSLNEYGFKHMQGDKKGEFLDKHFHTEREVFEFLDMPYVEPAQRLP